MRTGRIVQKVGMKMLVHNHTGEFEKLADSPRTSYDVLIEETDPALVTMQVDIGWVYIAGVDPIELFKRYPGRFELWPHPAHRTAARRRPARGSHVTRAGRHAGR
jgi:sugar phosphate isomerase/epimerase